MIRHCVSTACIVALGLSLTLAFRASSAEPTPAIKPAAPACYDWLPLYWCVKAPYTCKPFPCPPPCHDVTCDIYCKKPLPCPPPCFGVSCDVYCPKPPVCCFPGNPCGHCVECAKHGHLKHGGKK